MVYSYLPHALVEAFGRMNAIRFRPSYHQASMVLGILASKGFLVRGVLADDINSICVEEKMPPVFSLFHPELEEAFLNYVQELDELQLVEGTHPLVGDEICTYVATDTAEEWQHKDVEDILILLIDDLSIDLEGMDEELVEELRSRFPLTTVQRIALFEAIVTILDIEEPDLEETESDDFDDDPE